jgi:serine/threonine protein kinase
MKREAEIAKHLHHPSITTYIGLFVEEGELDNSQGDYYLVSYYVNGGLARDYLVANPRPDVAETLVRWFCSCFQISAIHEKNSSGI